MSHGHPRGNSVATSSGSLSLEEPPTVRHGIVSVGSGSGSGSVLPFGADDLL